MTKNWHGIFKKIEKLEKEWYIPDVDPVLAAEAELLEKSFYEFHKAAWHVFEPGKLYIDNWHIEAQCLHLQAAYEGYIKDLIIGMPPRSGKTSAFSITFVAWVWTRNASIKFIYASYALEKVAEEHGRLCQLLIMSPWYQARWGDKVTLSPNQNTKVHFVNLAGGHRITTSIGGAGASLGADIKVLDDPNNTKESANDRARVIDWFRKVWSSRLNPGGLEVNIIGQQRTDPDDVTGYALKSEAGGDYIHLRLPMEYNPETKCETIVLPGMTEKWCDPRSKKGELLCGDYIPLSLLTRIRKSLGTYIYSGQYNLDPKPEGGGLIQIKHIEKWVMPRLPKLDYVIQSWDTAFTDNKQNAYSACTSWGIFRINNINNLILLSVWRGHVSYPQLLARAVALYKNWNNIGEDIVKLDKTRRVDQVLIESKASGYSLISDFIDKKIPVKGFNPDKWGDKMMRVHRITPFIEANLIWFRANPATNKFLPDAQILLENCEAFPVVTSRDLVDTMTQSIIHVAKQMHLLKHIFDYDWSEDELSDDEKAEFKRDNNPAARSYFGMMDNV